MSLFDDDQNEGPARKKWHVERRPGQEKIATDSRQNNPWGHGAESDDEDSAPVFSRGESGRVGLRLLQQMQHLSAEQGKCPPASNNISTLGKLHVVEDYVPLFVGGFMETSTDSAMDNLSNIRPGDIMCVRCPSSVGGETKSSDKAQNVTYGDFRGATTGMSFVKETELTPEERQYGRRLTCDMMREIFEVSRLDRATNSLEAVFLDGTRKKLKAYAVRPAGFVECEVFRRWKADEGSRPVQAVYSTATSQDGESSAASLDCTTGQVVKCTADAVWWVVPHLIVRLVERTAGDLFGQKFVVKSVAKKDGKVRLESLRTEGVTSCSEEGNIALTEEKKKGTVLDVFGCSALETVVPKVGSQGLVVQGSMRGELVVVTSRVRGADGDIETVRVRSTLTEKEFSVKPGELCSIFTPK